MIGLNGKRKYGKKWRPLRSPLGWILCKKHKSLSSRNMQETVRSTLKGVRKISPLLISWSVFHWLHTADATTGRDDAQSVQSQPGRRVRPFQCHFLFLFRLQTSDFRLRTPDFPPAYQNFALCTLRSALSPAIQQFPVYFYALKWYSISSKEGLTAEW